MQLIYSIALFLITILGSPYWAYRILLNRNHIRSLGSRFGFTLPPYHAKGNPVWFHAVSVGEVLAAKPLIRALKDKSPGVPIVVSTVTSTGNNLARQELPGVEAVFYFPFDWSFCVRRFLNSLLPRAVVLMETELWPNFLHQCRRRGVPVCIANARLSDRSFPRYRAFRHLLSGPFQAIQFIGTQTTEDRHRFMTLGFAESRVKVTGNLKFDPSLAGQETASDLIARLRSWFPLDPDTPLLVVGSSMKGEEEIFLEAFAGVRRQVQGVRLLLAPRHPERFDDVAGLVARKGWTVRRRTDSDQGPGTGVDVVILDSMGELRAVYALATIAIIGGSFKPFGGHNILEPAAFGRAIVFGPEMGNFEEIADLFLREQAARRCTAESLVPVLIELLADGKARDALGKQASATYSRHQGATARTLEFLLPLIS